MEILSLQMHDTKCFLNTCSTLQLLCKVVHSISMHDYTYTQGSSLRYHMIPAFFKTRMVRFSCKKWYFHY